MVLAPIGLCLLPVGCDRWYLILADVGGLSAGDGTYGIAVVPQSLGNRLPGCG